MERVLDNNYNNSREEQFAEKFKKPSPYYFRINPNTGAATVITRNGTDVEGLAMQSAVVLVPTTLALLGIGLFGLGFYAHKKIAVIVNFLSLCPLIGAVRCLSLMGLIPLPLGQKLVENQQIQERS